MEQLQGMDASFVAMEQPNAPMHIGSILIYDPSTAENGFVRYKDILKFFGDRMQLSKTMRQRLVKVPFGIDYPYWVEDPDFDLEYHVRHVALPKPGDWRQLCIQAARIFARPLDLTRPPWEYTVVEGLDNIPGIPPGSFAFITKVHHAAIDGMSGVDLMEAQHTLDPKAPPPDTPDTWQADRLPDPISLFMRGYVKGMFNPLRQMEVATRAMPGFVKAARGLYKKEYSLDTAINTPRTRFNARISPNRVVESQVFKLADLKRIRVLAPGAKINDVFLTIIGGALRQYLETHDELPDTSLTAMAPISVRSNDEKNSMGNQVSAMVAPLGTHIADPAERLRYVHQQTINSKAMTEAMGARQMTEMSKVSPALFMALGAQLYTRLGIANVMKPVVNTVVTNVPGPPVPIYSTGAQLLSMHGLICLGDGLGLGHVVQSYCAQATITITACRKLMPDPEYYAQCLQDSFDVLLSAAEAEEARIASEPTKPKTARAKSAAPRATAKATPVKAKAPAKKRAPKKVPVSKPSQAAARAPAT